ncbi:hypothetical protein LINGRAHAP2_LOCUS27253 [Linum grandiflorum]
MHPQKNSRRSSKNPGS